jgi:GTP-binding protein HflX
MQLINIILPYSEGKLISAFHEQGQVTKVENGKDFVKIEGYLPERFLADFKPFMRKTGKSTDI